MTGDALDRAALAAIIRRHGLQAPEGVPAPWTGATSRVYPCGEVVIKVPVDEPAAIASLHIDAAIGPVARSLGVATPELVALDETRELLPVPYAVLRRIGDAVPLERHDRSDGAVVAWREVGRELALVHAVRDADRMPVSLRSFRQTPEVDPRPWVDELRERGALAATDARWLHRLLDELAPAALADVPLALCHGDVNAANILVDGASGAFRALIDWAGAGWLDPAWDLAGVPLAAVPHLLAGHREVAPLPGDATAAARALWCQLQMRLSIARSGQGDVSLNLGAMRRAAVDLLG